MNKRIDYSNQGGFPVTEYTFDYMQQSYRNALAGIAGLVGDNVIISGMIDGGDAVTDGWITYGGELVPFIAGPKQSTFIITTDSESRTFNDGVVHTVYFNKYARFGSGAGAINFSTLQRISQLKNIQGHQQFDIIEIGVNADYLTANFDNAGLGKNLRAGWALCNGQNGTPDKRSRYQVGYDLNNADYNTPGKIGGEATHTLIKAELPAISLGIKDPVDGGNYIYQTNSSGGNRIALKQGSYSGSSSDIQTDLLGSGQAFKMQPGYITSVYIMKL